MSKVPLLSLLKKWTGSLLRAQPLLVGYSGGGDSKALLYALRELDLPLPLIAVHINHGWRKESDQEEKEILQECLFLGIRLYHQKIKSPNSKNREDAARKERLLFFREVAQKEGAQGVVLAHHAKDQAETVLKRVLEGSFFSKVSSMEEKTQIAGVCIFRPLLQTPKKELLQFLKERNLSFFQDPTNLDRAYLRSRMRQEVFPYLESAFGKQVENNLLHMAAQSRAFTAYIREKIAPIEEAVLQGPFGFVVLSLSKNHPLERRYFLEISLRKQGILRRSLLQRVEDAIEKGQSGVFFPAEKTILYLYRGSLFFLKTSLPTLEERRVCVEGSLAVSPPKPTLWQEYFQGMFRFFVPAGYYTLKKAPIREQRKLAKKGIPLCIRHCLYGLFSETGDFYSPFSYPKEAGKTVECLWEKDAAPIKISSETTDFAIVTNGGR